MIEVKVYIGLPDNTWKVAKVFVEESDFETQRRTALNRVRSTLKERGTEIEFLGVFAQEEV